MRPSLTLALLASLTLAVHAQQPQYQQQYALPRPGYIYRDPYTGQLYQR